MVVTLPPLQPAMRPDIPTILKHIKPHVCPSPGARPVEKCPSGAALLPLSELSRREARLEEKQAEMARKEMKLQERATELAQWEKRLEGIKPYIYVICCGTSSNPKL